MWSLLPLHQEMANWSRYSHFGPTGQFCFSVKLGGEGGPAGFSRGSYEKGLAEVSGWFCLFSLRLLQLLRSGGVTGQRPEKRTPETPGGIFARFDSVPKGLGHPTNTRLLLPSAALPSLGGSFFPTRLSLAPEKFMSLSGEAGKREPRYRRGAASPQGPTWSQEQNAGLAPWCHSTALGAIRLPAGKGRAATRTRSFPSRGTSSSVGAHARPTEFRRTADVKTPTRSGSPLPRKQRASLSSAAQR